MTIADKLLELNDVKQDIKTAIEDKGVDMTDVPFTDYPTKIDSITVGTGMSYHDYAKILYSMWGYESFFTEAWTESQNSLDVLFEIPLMLAVANQNFLFWDLDLYVGTNSALTNFYNLVASGEFPENYAIIVNKSVVRYLGVDTEGGLPVYIFGYFNNSPAVIDHFLMADLTPLDMGLGIALGKFAGTVIPNNSITIRRGFENYDAGVIIPEMIETVGDYAFESFGYSDPDDAPFVPYIIGHNVKYIGDNGFARLKYQQPVTIPDSVEWIGASAFSGYKTNTNFIVVPRNVTYIGEGAFSGNGYIWGSTPGSTSFTPPAIMYSEIPPVIGDSQGSPFASNICSIYVPDDAVDAYKSAWPENANYIKAISSLHLLGQI